MVDVANFCRLNIEFIVFALADYDALAVVFQLLVLVVLEVILEGVFIVVDDFIVVVYIVIFL